MGTVYHPTNAENSEMLNYLIECLSFIESNYSNCGIIILGDFNRLNIIRLKNNFNLKQIVNFPTRGQNILDLVLTNLKNFYEKPEKLSPFGLSDHVTIKVRSRTRVQHPIVKSTIKSREAKHAAKQTSCGEILPRTA